MAIVNVFKKEEKPQKPKRPEEPKKIVETEPQETNKTETAPNNVTADDYIKASELIIKEKEKLLAEGKPLIIDGVEVHRDYTPLNIIFNRARKMRSKSGD